jgi:DNA-binding Lrp family transcriptional regulator
MRQLVPLTLGTGVLFLAACADEPSRPPQLQASAPPGIAADVTAAAPPSCPSDRVTVTDLGTLQDFEATVAGFEEVVEFRRMFGRPDYFLRVLVADQTAYEEHHMKLLGLPAVSRVVSHQTMKRIKTRD